MLFRVRMTLFVDGLIESEMRRKLHPALILRSVVVLESHRWTLFTDVEAETVDDAKKLVGTIVDENLGELSPCIESLEAVPKSEPSPKEPT